MAELPSGAVTFLFSDIEGSTRLVKELRERYGDVLGEHQRLLRAAFEAHGGYEVDTQGDSFFIAFSSARDALLAAVEGQLALLAHPWPDGVRIKVRMGVHTGQAVASGGRYTGLAVHRAARIGAAGHGGQILVSQATQTLVEDEEEDLHIHLQDLGEQRLKDLDRPVRLYQAAADGLPTEFLPLRPDAELAPVAPVVPFWRRRATIAAAAVGAALVVAVIAALLLRGGETSVAVRANSVAVVDPANGRVVDDIHGRDSAGPDHLRRRIGLGGEPGRPIGDQDRCAVREDGSPSISRSRTGRRRASRSGSTPCGWRTACVDRCRESTRSSTISRSQSRS